MTRPVVVLGMHRSGTSCLAGLLQEAGVDFGEVPTRSIGNARGSREHPEVVSLNDSVLSRSGGSWDYPPTTLRWSRTQKVRRDSFIEMNEGKLWGFKDPRTLLTLPFWEDGLSEPRFIATVRHPFAVAKSLEKARGIDFFDGLDLWLKYNHELLKARCRLGFPVLSFNLEASSYDRAARAAISSLGLTPGNGIFFADSLRHSKETPPKLGEPFESVYRELIAC